jgi:hypothetical protein
MLLTARPPRSRVALEADVDERLRIVSAAYRYRRKEHEDDNDNNEKADREAG